MDLPMPTVRLYTDTSALETLDVHWRQLVERTSGVTVFQTPEWALGWLRACERRVLPFAIAHWAGEQLVGLAPLYIETTWGVRVVRFMGGEHNDSNCLLAEPAEASQLHALVLQAFGQHADKWDVLQLRGLDEDEIWAQHIRRQMPAARLLRQRPCPVPTITLPDTWQDYWSGLSARRRKSLRLARRRLEAHGEVTCRILTEPGALAEALPQFFAARMDNWRARKQLHRMVAVQRNPGYWSTLTDICLKLAARGCVWLACLQVDRIAVAWDLAFVTNGIVADYLTTYDLRLGCASPGQLVTIELIRWAIEQGAHSFVMGRGAQPYKYWFGAAPRMTENLLLAANRPRGRAYVHLQAMQEDALEMARAWRTQIK